MCERKWRTTSTDIHFFFFFSVWLFPKYLHELKYNSYVTLTTLEMDIEDACFFFLFFFILFFLPTYFFTSATYKRGFIAKSVLDVFIPIAKLRRSLVLSKKISNDQELIQSDPISCPQNQKGNN